MKGYFRKRGNKWSFTIDIRKDSFTGKRIQKTRSGFKTKKEAQEECAKLINELTKGQYIEPSKMLYADYLISWLDSKRKIRKSTHDKYFAHIKNHIRPGLGNVELSKLNSFAIDKFYKLLEEEKGLSGTTVADIHTIVKSSLGQAQQRGMIYKNEALLVEPPSKNKKEIQVWTVEEANKFLDVAKDTREYIAFLLALTTGMRQSEILGLTWSNVSMDEQTIAVTQTLTHDGKEIVKNVKSKNSHRLISIDTQTLFSLKKHKQLINKEKLLLGQAYTDLDLVIPTSLGTPTNPRNLLRTQYQLTKEANVKKINFHGLRHTHATELLAAGENPKAVAERIGDNVRTLMETYAHILPNMQKELANKFGDRFHIKNTN